MEAISAVPTTIKKLFNDTFIIPEFQRPYSWEEEECEQLWVDFLNFHTGNASQKEQYFLGNIVIYPNSDKTLSLIDGQQRITTLSLLIKCLHLKAGTYKALENCLKISDQKTGDFTENLKLTSLVLDEDKKSFKEIILQGGVNSDIENIFKRNFLHLQTLVSEWWNSCAHNSDCLDNLINDLLENVVILPITCSSEDDALTIFETLNNRGRSLSDTDIFKAKLYKTSQDKGVFIDEWNALEEHGWLFRIHMHVLRAKNKDTSKEIGLRTYFSDETKLQKDSVFLFESLKIYQAFFKSQISVKADSIWKILDNYPNHYWCFPLYVFTRKYGAINKHGELFLTQQNTLKLEKLMEELLRFCIVKGTVYNSVNTIKDTIFNLSSQIWNEIDYLEPLKKSYQNDISQFKEKIKASNFGRYLRVIVLTLAYKNPVQNEDEFNEILDKKYDIEHILPKKWAHYDKWDEKSWEAHLNSLGNLVLCEKKYNIQAQNSFFTRKQDVYKLSKIQDILDLTKKVQKHWYPEDVTKRTKDSIQRLDDFIDNSKQLK